MTSPIRVLKSVCPKLMPFFKSVTIYFVLLIPADSPSIWSACIKCAPILSLMFFVLLHGMGRKDEYTFSRRILVGLGFSCIGDALLIWPNQFLSGMAAFGLAQIAYITAFGFKPLRLKLGIFIYCLTLLVVLKLLPGAHGLLKFGLPIYSILLSSMVWRAIARVHFSSEWTWTELCSGAGGICFTISDTLIGFQYFHHPIKHVQLLIMSTYYLAQLGIALSVVDSITAYKWTQEKLLQEKLSAKTCHSLSKEINKAE